VSWRPLTVAAIKKLENWIRGGKTMEKFGVDTGSNPGEKIANATGKCPRCGAELDKDAPVPKCPVHGTEPFEKKGP
jgi:hypothetical protein